MENHDSAPLLAQLRNRQTELVAALAVETSTSRLAALSTELESVLEQIQQHDRQAP
ncbi:hypothetical protein QNO08_02095 [Arthrobacter sp. zg-Y820]|uniref:hypothetical protein n=1 Tax=unclassified Arthrobacter TaxID=235627 RepID=UPI001E4B3E83|nr:MULTISPECIES: hypothetical protein [unclassified Arthrobacter]MCC9198571.1 hypothetical protein [Arthrobacter sp. zg-Y820]MDK1281441.1 hypothetical protein [Arthrobacter sp. zg.Y820]MDK1361856.1 hypothetical protein [Arthrobacter sp. zg-Y1219]WIB09883.1 hypothetical protein QNO08_02095 [Arthrobacter sp. zg-Y820]